MASELSHVTVDTSSATHAPKGYILAYGESYRGVSCDGKALGEVGGCPLSACDAHDAFVNDCGFSPLFPALAAGATKSRMLEDVRRAATTMTSNDVVVVYFSGRGALLGDTACAVDAAGGLVTAHKLQAVFAEAVVERGLRGVAFLILLDCHPTPSIGELMGVSSLLFQC